MHEPTEGGGEVYLKIGIGFLKQHHLIGSHSIVLIFVHLCLGDLWKEHVYYSLSQGICAAHLCDF